MSRKSFHPSELAQHLWELHCFERATAVTLAGWIPKIPDIDLKFDLAHQLYDSLRSASDLSRRYGAFMSALGTSVIPTDHLCDIARFMDADDSPSVVAMLRALTAGRASALAVGSALMVRVHAPSDPATVLALDRVIKHLRGELRWARQRGVGELPTFDWQRITSLEGSRRRSDLGTWRPLDRVPSVARPSEFRRGKSGAIRVLSRDQFYDAYGIGVFLHNFVNEEIATLELVSRNSYEHPEMPLEFHLDCGRQASDEARHARLLMDLARDFGVEYGSLPVYVSSYEAMYQFAPCEQGSSRELLWRILLRQVFHEGLALDSLGTEVLKRGALGQKDLARTFEYLLTDEVFHARAGLHWSRHLCQGDGDLARRELAEAHRYFVRRVKDARARFVAHHLDEAMAELDLLDEIAESESSNGPSVARGVNEVARHAAGYSRMDLDQLASWGYL